MDRKTLVEIERACCDDDFRRSILLIQWFFSIIINNRVITELMFFMSDLAIGLSLRQVVTCFWHANCLIVSSEFV